MEFPSLAHSSSCAVPPYQQLDDFVLPLESTSYLPYENDGDAFLSLEYYPSLNVGASLSLEDGPSLDVDAGKFPPRDCGRRLMPGIKFRPTDEEVVVHYLRPRSVNDCSEPGGPITNADIYEYEPQQLSGLTEDDGDGRMYFYTKIKKLGKSKTDRSVKSKKGYYYWKPTQAPKPIKGQTGNTIGYKTPLAYHENKIKTQWLMQEYKLDSHNSYSSQELVVAVVYHRRRSPRGRAHHY